MVYLTQAKILNKLTRQQLKVILKVMLMATAQWLQASHVIDVVVFVCAGADLG